MDVVIWSSKEEALEAAKSIMEKAEAGIAFSVIDEKTIHMSHYEIL
jgi:hypothetical protein